MPQSWEEVRKATEQEEQRFINAWADLKTRELQSLFPVTSKTVKDEHGNRTHETTNPQALCKHLTVRAIRWIPKMVEQEVDREIPDTEWNEKTKTWDHNGKYKTIRTIESKQEGQEREWTCTTCDMHIPESALQRMYPEIKFDKPEVNLGIE